MTSAVHAKPSTFSAYLLFKEAVYYGLTDAVNTAYFAFFLFVRAKDVDSSAVPNRNKAEAIPFSIVFSIDRSFFAADSIVFYGHVKAFVLVLAVSKDVRFVYLKDVLYVGEKDAFAVVVLLYAGLDKTFNRDTSKAIKGLPNVDAEKDNENPATARGKATTSFINSLHSKVFFCLSSIETTYKVFTVVFVL